MLVLSRKLQDEIVIGDNIRITVVKIKGNTVRLGIDAPRDIKVVRGELPRNPEPSTVRVEAEDESVANVTVVFTDPIDRKGNSGRMQGSEAEVLKFDKSAGENCSISFRQTTPEILKHNRLKQIVEEISKSNIGS